MYSPRMERTLFTNKNSVISEIRSIPAERTPFVYKMGFIRFSLVVGNDLFEFT